jgi:hypothetical protein
MKNGVPVATICQRLKKKAPEICALKFAGGGAGGAAGGAPAITAATDLNTLKVGQLKAFMAEKNIACATCLEKADYVNRIREYFAKEL